MFMMPTAGLRHFPGPPSGLLVGNLGFQCGYFLLPFLNLWERVISEGNCFFLHTASLSAIRLLWILYKHKKMINSFCSMLLKI